MNLDPMTKVRSAAPGETAAINQPAAAGSVTKSNATQVAATDTVANWPKPMATRQFQLPVRVGGWAGIHDFLVFPQLAAHAEATGVTFTLEIAEKHWWKGTLYNVNVEGSPESISRFVELTRMRPFILA